MVPITMPYWKGKQIICQIIQVNYPHGNKIDCWNPYLEPFEMLHWQRPCTFLATIHRNTSPSWMNALLWYWKPLWGWGVELKPYIDKIHRGSGPVTFLNQATGPTFFVTLEHCRVESFSDWTTLVLGWEINQGIKPETQIPKTKLLSAVVITLTFS